MACITRFWRLGAPCPTCGAKGSAIRPAPFVVRCVACNTEYRSGDALPSSYTGARAPGIVIKA